jgi:hypothetical protein
MVRAMFRRTVNKVFLALVLVACPVAIGACGGGAKSAESASVKPGEMPAGEDWSGVYYSPVYGMLHLVLEGDTLSGAWRTAAGDSWGEMSGKVNGDIFKYEWTEHKIGMVGPHSSTHGRGYFRYTMPKAGDPAEITGEWGLNTDEVGNTWKATKQVNQKPDPKSVRPDEVEGRVEGGGWDDSAKPPPQKKESDESGSEGGGGLE